MESLNLSELEDETIDYILGLSPPARAAYFASLVKSFYPKIEIQSTEWQHLMEAYAASWYAEKIYRYNRFFNESFTAVYTETGLIRDIVLDIYFNDDDLIVH
jgi:hypothetical protein